MGGGGEYEKQNSEHNKHGLDDYEATMLLGSLAVIFFPFVV